jgi:two-component system, chemotaxis family, chemotaxis protein CheY
MKKCLVADDSAVIRKVARRILEQQAYEVDDASDARELMGRCDDVMPEAILLDWNLPDQDGMDTIKSIRAMPRGDYPKIIFCMLEHDPVQAARAIQLGANEVIMKPFDKAMLLDKLREVGFH